MLVSDSCIRIDTSGERTYGQLQDTNSIDDDGKQVAVAGLAALSRLHAEHCMRAVINTA